jgi:hypothetical protein
MKPNVKTAYFSVPQCVEMYSGTYLFITAGILDNFSAEEDDLPSMR